MSMHEREGSFKRNQMHYSPNLLNTIYNAIDHRKLTEIEYDSREKGISNRSVEPMEVIYKGGKRTLVAYCKMRSDYRCFRLDRINQIKMLVGDYIPRPDFKLSDYMEEGDSRDERW